MHLYDLLKAGAVERLARDLKTLSVEVLNGKLAHVDVRHAAQVDCHLRRAVGHPAARKRLDAEVLAEEMLDSLAVEEPQHPAVA